MTGPLTIRPVSPDDDPEAEFDLRHRAFGPPQGDREGMLAELRDFIADGALIGAWDGGVQVGSARVHDIRQWWGGLALPMGGVGGVKVAPEARGQGVGRAVMTELLALMSRRGYALSVLYPATANIYRSLGWELAGGNYRATIPGRSLASLLAGDPRLSDEPPGPLSPSGTAGGSGGSPPRPALRRVGPEDAEEVIAVIGAVHAAARHYGPCTRDARTLRRWISRPDFFGYLAPDGFLGYGWRQAGGQELMVHTLQAASAPTARALWGIVASHATVAEAVHANIAPHDPIGWLTREPDLSLREWDRWMLRVIDPRAAIAGRGFPAATAISVPLVLTDPDLPANSGMHTLTVGDGRGHLLSGPTEPAPDSPASGPVKFGPRGFAALFAGVPMATLRLAGLVAGGDASTDVQLDGAFAAQPFMLDYF
jgi:predicted N-acetyltransferase YhbS